MQHPLRLDNTGMILWQTPWWRRRGPCLWRLWAHYMAWTWYHHPGDSDGPWQLANEKECFKAHYLSIWTSRHIAHVARERAYWTGCICSPRSQLFPFLSIWKLSRALIFLTRLKSALFRICLVTESLISWSLLHFREIINGDLAVPFLLLLSSYQAIVMFWTDFNKGLCIWFPFCLEAYW